MPDVTSEFRLERGSNALIAVRRYSPEPDEVSLGVLAFELALMLGGLPEYAGRLGSGYVYVIGQGRPVVLRGLPRGDRLMRWYRQRGQPVGDDPEFAAVAIEWRGSPREVSVPSSSVWVIPQPARQVSGAHAMPDGSVAEQAQYLDELSEAEAATRLRERFGWVSRVAAVGGGLGTAVLVGSGIGLGLVAALRAIGGR